LIKKNDYYETEIISDSGSGDGICKIDNMVVFVPGTVVGDIAKIKIIKVKSSYAIARLEGILEPSVYRTDDICACSAKCGGCQMPNTVYAKQLEIKKKTVVDALERIGGIDLKDVEVYDTLGMAEPFRYRNKMVFPFGKGENGEAVGGFYSLKSHNIVPLNDCMLGDETACSYLKETLKFLNENKISVYDETKNSGVARRLFVRFGVNTKQSMIVLSVNADSVKNSEQLIEKLLAIKSEYTVKSIILNVNKGKNNAVLGFENKVLYGDEKITDTLCGKVFNISPNSFFQVNPKQTEVLYNKAIEYASLDKTQNVMDLYCGIGTISLCCVPYAKSVCGIEEVEVAIENAKKNAELNGIKNADFFAGKAEDLIGNFASDGKKYDVVIVDPPRKGCEETVIKTITEMSPKRVVYVSCNPSTLARDLKIFTQNGYRVKKVQPVDMFPHTSHVETVVLLQRQNT